MDEKKVKIVSYLLVSLFSLAFVDIFTASIVNSVPKVAFKLPNQVIYKEKIAENSERKTFLVLSELFLADKTAKEQQIKRQQEQRMLAIQKQLFMIQEFEKQEYSMNQAVTVYLFKEEQATNVFPFSTSDETNRTGREINDSIATLIFWLMSLISGGYLGTKFPSYKIKSK